MKFSKKISMIFLSSLLCFSMTMPSASGTFSVGSYSFPMVEGDYAIWNTTDHSVSSDIGKLIKVNITGSGEYLGGYSLNCSVYYWNDNLDIWGSDYDGALFNVTASGDAKYPRFCIEGYPFFCPTPVTMTVIDTVLKNTNPYFTGSTIDGYTINLTWTGGYWFYAEISTNGIAKKIINADTGTTYTLEYVNSSFNLDASANTGNPNPGFIPFGSEFLVITGASVVLMVYIVRRKTRVKKI